MSEKKERVGEWGLVKKMSVPAHSQHTFICINTFPDSFYISLHNYIIRLAVAIFAANAPATKPASIFTTVRTEQD
jgi:hypothetical protein